MSESKQIANMSDSTIVIEIGSCFIKVGLGGQAIPRLLVPVDHYVLQSCDDVVWMSFLSQILIDRLLIKPKECRVLVLEDICSLDKQRNTIYRILAHEFKVLPKIYVYSLRIVIEL
jgi:hypothetical protein